MTSLSTRTPDTPAVRSCPRTWRFSFAQLPWWSQTEPSSWGSNWPVQVSVTTRSWAGSSTPSTNCVRSSSPNRSNDDASTLSLLGKKSLSYTCDFTTLCLCFYTRSIMILVWGTFCRFWGRWELWRGPTHQNQRRLWWWGSWETWTSPNWCVCFVVSYTETYTQCHWRMLGNAATITLWYFHSSNMNSSRISAGWWGWASVHESDQWSVSWYR